MPWKRFSHSAIALGGTFDRFHAGHERLISAAFRSGERVLIGVSSDRFVRTLDKRHSVEPYSSRVRNLRHFLRSRGWSPRATIAPLNDPYGPAARRRDLEAIVVTPETFSSAKKLNQLRKSKALSVLKIYRVQLSRAEDGKPISSTRIRGGKIDRRGKLLQK